MSDLQELWNRVRQRIGATDQETQDLLVRVTTGLTMASVRASVGEDVRPEMLHLKAQVSNLNAEIQTALGEEVRNWLLEKVGMVIAGVLAG